VDLFEYQGKQYFAKFGIPVSAGGPADTVDEAVKVAESAKYPVRPVASSSRTTPTK
jgi:succinyl-CoA synthetase beta subunit